MTCVPPRSARRSAWSSRARRLLLFRLPADTRSWLSRESDDRATGSRSASMANAACGRRTRLILSGLHGDEIGKIRVGEHAAGALLALADADVAEISSGDVLAQGLDRDAEMGG